MELGLLDSVSPVREEESNAEEEWRSCLCGACYCITQAEWPGLISTAVKQVYTVKSERDDRGGFTVCSVSHYSQLLTCCKDDQV